MTVDKLLTIERWQAQVQGSILIESASAIRDFGARSLGSCVQND